MRYLSVSFTCSEPLGPHSFDSLQEDFEAWCESRSIYCSSDGLTFTRYITHTSAEYSFKLRPSKNVWPAGQRGLTYVAVAVLFYLNDLDCFRDINISIERTG